MKLAVSHDAQGNIVTLFDPKKLRGENVSFEYVPAKGEMHSVFDVPKEFESKPLHELPKLLRINTSGAHPRMEPRA